MAKKRKPDASRLDEVDRTMYSTFCSAANSLSQIYTQAMSQQKLAFQSGERHALEKLYQWIVRQHGADSRVTAADIIGYLQNEILGGGGDDDSADQQHLGSIPNVQEHGSAASPHRSICPAVCGGLHHQPFHFAQGLDNSAAAGAKNDGGGQREANSQDSSMDMFSDSPDHDSYYTN